MIDHPGAPAPPPAWLAAERAASVVGPQAAVAGLLGQEEVAVAPVRVGGAAAHPPTLPPPPPVCHLAPRPTGVRFADPAVDAYLRSLFTALPGLRRAAGLPPVALNRWDLFHAHLFWAASAAPAASAKAAAAAARRGGSRRGGGGGAATPGHLGLLFHCAEYPARSPPAFDVDLGWCQRGSPLAWDAASADARNVVALGGRVATLACAPGGALGVGLIWPALREVRTLVEADLGAWARLDITFLGGGVEEVGAGGGGQTAQVVAFWVGGGGGGGGGGV